MVVEQLRQRGIAPLKKELRREDLPALFAEWPSFYSTSGQRSTRPGDLCSVLCSSTMYLDIYVSCSLNTYAHEDVPSVPGSSGSPRLISCKVVPSCRNEGRFAQGGPPLAAPNPRRPKCAGPSKMVSATWNYGHPPPRAGQSQMSCPHETSRVRLYATAHGTM